MNTIIVDFIEHTVPHMACPISRLLHVLEIVYLFRRDEFTPFGSVLFRATPFVARTCKLING